MTREPKSGMQVAFDASNLAVEAPTGVAIYGTHLIREIAALDKENQYTLCYRLSRWKDRPGGPNTSLSTPAS